MFLKVFIWPTSYYMIFEKPCFHSTYMGSTLQDISYEMSQEKMRARSQI